MMAGINSALPEGACVVSVMHMVNPAMFWVSEPSGQDMTDERGQLQALEESLQSHCRHVSFYQHGCYMPEEKEMVAVLHPKTQRWHRGRVEGVLNMASGFVYKVFLVDHGIPLQVRSSSIQELPSTFESLGYQAMQMVLHGVVPITRELDFERTNMSTTILDHWTAAAVRFVKKLLSECEKAYIVYHKNTKHVIYGDLYLELEDGIVSLKNELCEKEYAIFNENLFEQDCEENGNCNKPSFALSSTDGCSSHDYSPCRSPKPASSERRNIREYLAEFNEKKKMKEKEKLERIEQWRYDNEVFQQDRDDDAPLGRGISIRRRAQITPGGLAQTQQKEVCDSATEQMSGKSLLDLLDMMSGVNESSQRQMEVSAPSKIISHPVDSKPPQVKPSKESRSISYMPAGAAISNPPQQTKLPSSHSKLSDNKDTTSFSQKTVGKPLSERLKSAVNLRNDNKAEKLNGFSSKSSGFHDKPENNNKITENPNDSRKLSELLILDNAEFTPDHSTLNRNYTDDGKVEKLNNVSSQDSELRNTSTNSRKMTENSINTGDDVRSGENFKKPSSEERVRVVASKPMSLLQRLQEKAKRAKKADDVVQNIMDDIIKSSQSKSQVQLESLKSSEQRSGTQVKEDLRSKSMLGLPVDYKLMDRSSAARLLVHGDMRSRPIQSIADANFPLEIHQAMGKMDLKNPMRIQMYAWPAIMRGQYTVLVGPPRSGKTMSYVVPVVSFMLTPDMYSELPPGNGPLVLVLCSGSKSAEFIYDKCCTLLQFARRTEVRVQLALGGGCEVDLRDHLANGCDILVSTPRCFLRLLRSSHLITNLDRVAHLILDEVDILAEKFLPEIKKILSECKNILMRRTKVEVPIQLIAASEKWCPAVEQFSQHVSQEFVICISGHLEAAVYAKLRPTLHYLSSRNKIQKLLDILDGDRGLYKTLVVCKDASEVDMLEPFLLSQCFNVVTAHEDKTHSHNRETYQRWKNCVAGSYPVMVCSDDVLPEMDARNAMWLIHYSLPPTKTKFGFRFSSLMDNYSSVFHKSSADDDDPDCAVHIFMDKDSDGKELPVVVQLMKRLSIPVHPELEARAAEVTKQQESQKSSALLCYNLKAFGECLEKTNCPNRHVVLSAFDNPINVPRHGNVKLKILHVLDASRFAARLLQYKDENGSTVQASDGYFEINVAVLKHYSSARNRGLHGVPKLGDVCGLENKINIFLRVQVVEIVREDEKNIPEDVRVYSLDEGLYKEVKVYQLLSLPAHLQQFPPQTVEVFLCNVIPCDLDTCWSQEANYRMSSWMRKISAGETEGKFVAGKIVLSLGNTLWLDPLKCCSHLESVDTFVTEVSLRTELLKSRLAVENPRHVKNLLAMCREAEILVAVSSPVERQPVELKEVLPTPQWAHLPCDDYQTVVFICATDPHEFFVRRNDFDKCFQELVAEIQNSIKTKPKVFDVEKGSLCIGKFPEDGVWYRARVNEILEDKLVSLFFVDHGDFAAVSIDDIAPITHKLITKLPFQAIECSLAGVRPVSEDIWCEDATDLLYDFTDNCPILHVKVCEVLEEGRCTGGKKYQVLCVDTNTKEDIMLNKLLVERNLAVSDNAEQLEEEEAVKLKQEDSSDESDIEIDSCVVKLSDVCNEVKPSDFKQDTMLEEDSQDEYDIVVDDGEDFIKRMFGLDKLAQMISPPGVSNTKLPALPAPESTMHRTSSVGSLSSDCLSDEECIPPLASYTKAPETLWYQDHCTVGVKIRLTGVIKYYLTWDLKQFKFRTELNDDIYEVGDELFGPIIPSELSHSAKGLYVHIKMKKAVRGFTWPRLFNSRNRKIWLKYDLDMLKEDSGISLQARDNAKVFGLEQREWEEAVIIPEIVETDEEDYRDDDEDDGSDAFDVMGTPYDPYDPLN